MTVLRARAPGKVNLALFLGPTRTEDGKHALVSLVEPVTLADWLELGPAPDGTPGDEIVCEGVEGPNLAGEALSRFRAATGWDGPPQRLTIFKRVPVAAGMGGGSADAAAALRLAERASGRAAPEALHAELGADVPAAVLARPAIMEGAGERLTPLDGVPPHALVVVPSEETLSTAAVYAEADRLELPRPHAELANRRADIERALAAGELPIANDLAPAARRLSASIDAALDDARSAGARHALVCGSGPTVIGVFMGDRAEDDAKLAAEELRARHPRACAVTPAPAGYAAVREFAAEGT
jgi:4-diphosphocytidyl-2-C-methyl-D-erythritol kinase